MGGEANAPLLVIVGPTAAGKSALAMALAETIGGEIVSADSVQVYRGLDIGSAKPTLDDRARIPHHAIDLVDPTETLDAHAWVAAAEAAIADIRTRGRAPVVCGGTGLYIRALLHGLSPIPAIDDGVRAHVMADLEARGAPALHAELAQVDPAAAARIDPSDPQRTCRALEVFRQTGRPLSDWQAEQPWAPGRTPAQVFGLWPEREVLTERIATRVDGMVAAGLVDEVRALLAAGVPGDRGPLTSLGYREVVAHLAGALPGPQLAEAIARGHRRYARRQLTWFRGITTREDGLVHLDPARDRVLEHLVEAALGR